MDPPDGLLWAALDRLPVGVFAVDPTGRIVLWNAEAARLTGSPAAKAIGALALDMGIAPADSDRAGQILDRLLAGQAWAGEFPVQGAGGRRAYFHSVPVTDDAGQLVAVVSAFSEADAQRRDETFALLEGLFENAPLGFTYVDTDLRYQRVNMSVAEINGGTVDERIGRTIDDVHGEPCGPQFSAVCREVIRTGEARQVRIEGRLWHGTGPHQVWRMNYYPVFGDDGAVVGVGDVFIDVTDAERATAELVAAADARDYQLTRYQSLVDATSAAVWGRDAEGRIVEDSPSYRAITGQDARTYLADGPLAAVHPADRPQAERTWQEAVAAGELYEHVYRMRTASGEYRHFRVRAVPVRRDDRVAEWIGTETDIEAEVRARTRLELLSRATAAVNRELDTERELQALADALVPDFADVCTIHLIDPLVPGGPVTGRRLAQRVESAVPLPHSDDAFRFADGHPFAQMCRTGQPLLLRHPLQGAQRWADTDELARWEAELHWNTTLLAPILSGGTVVAALAFVSWGDRPGHTEEDLVFVAELATRASAAVEHAQRFQETRRASLTLQKAMLSSPPHVPGVEIEARYQPALADLEVGGDWYDAFVLPGGDIGLVVGDVVGHDLGAAAVMGQLRSMFRGVAMDKAMTPSAAITRLDELAVLLGITDFTTVLYGRLHRGPGGALFTWCSAGHVPPVLVLPDGGHRLLTEGAGLVVGVDPRTPRTDATVRLPPGSTLLISTDGLMERRTADLDDGLELLGTLAEELAHLPLAEFCDGLLARAIGDTGDDVVVLAARLPAG